MQEPKIALLAFGFIYLNYQTVTFEIKLKNVFFKFVKCLFG